MNKHRFRIQQLDLDNHKIAFCRLLIDLHQHYFADSDLKLASVIDYFDRVLVTHLDKYDVDICIDGDDTVAHGHTHARLPASTFVNRIMD